MTQTNEVSGHTALPWHEGRSHNVGPYAGSRVLSATDYALASARVNGWEALERERDGLREALAEAAGWIEARSVEGGYGFYRPENPHDFSPDHESCTDAEIAAHKAACEAWDRGDYKPPLGSELLSDEKGNPVMHILRAPWGIGSYTMTDPSAVKILELARALLGGSGAA